MILKGFFALNMPSFFFLNFVILIFLFNLWMLSGVSGKVDLDFSLLLSTLLYFFNSTFGNFSVNETGLNVYIASGNISYSSNWLFKGFNLTLLF